MNRTHAERKSATVYLCAPMHCQLGNVHFCLLFVIFFSATKSICFNWQARSDSLWRLERRIVQLYICVHTEYTIVSHTSELKCVNFLDIFRVCRLFICSFKHWAFVESRKPQKELFRPKSRPMHNVQRTHAHRCLGEILCLFNYCQQPAIGSACLNNNPNRRVSKT